MLQVNGLLNNPQSLFTKKPNWLGAQTFGGGDEERGLYSLLADGNTVAWYRPGVGVTGTLNASAWANQLGAAPSLAQATGANQPIYLPFAGTKYVYLPAVAANTVTTPTKTITGNFTITLDLALNDYTPAADVTIGGKTSGNDGFQVKWLTTDKVRLVIGDGVGLTNVDVVAASSFTNGSQHTVTIVWEDGVGATFKYDGVTSGSQVAAVKTLTNAAVSWTLGSATSIGKVYDHTMTNSGATTYYHLNPNASTETSTNAATWTSDNGEVYTLNNTGALLAQIVGSPQLLFDGTDDFLVTAQFAIDPRAASIYVVGKQPTWTTVTGLLDGRVGDSMHVLKQTASPKLDMYSTATLFAAQQGVTLNQKSVMTFVFNGASSIMKVDSAADATGTVGTTVTDAQGLVIGAYAAGTGRWGNWQISEVILRSVADSAATRAKIQRRLRQIHGTP